MFSPRISLPPLCRGLGGLEGSSQRSLQRNGTIRKTFSGGMAAIRRHSHCITVKLQAVSRTSTCIIPQWYRWMDSVSVTVTALQDALVNLIRRARPVFLQCVHAKTDSGSFDVPTLRVQLHSTQILSALQFHRTGQLSASGNQGWEGNKYNYSSTNLRFLTGILNPRNIKPTLQL